jgi:branched-chain amino acid transport system substrate-binding protein
VKATGTKDTEAVARKLKELPVDDQFAQGSKVLKTAAWCTTSIICSRSSSRRNRRTWDYYKQLAVVPGDKAFPSAKDSGCPLTK